MDFLSRDEIHDLCLSLFRETGMSRGSLDAPSAELNSFDRNARVMKRVCFRKTGRCRRRGAAAVEMALVAPIALALIFGIMQVGYAFMVQQMLQDSARKGCRAAILPSSSNASVTTAVNNVLAPMNLTGATTTVTVNGTVADVSTASYGDQVSVTVTIPFSNILLFSVNFANSAGSITGADVLRYE